MSSNKIFHQTGSVMLTILGTALSGFLLVYTIISLLYAWDWSYEIAPFLGLLIIRAIFVAVLAIVGLIVIPFKIGGLIMFWCGWATLIAGFLGLFVGISNRNESF